MLRRMKRPPGLWLLLSAGVLCLCFKDVSCVRATALIFAKSTTTSTTVSPDGGGISVNEEGVTEESAVNVTKSLLTGNPQLDYVHDPNLPRELNGYNLTEYPFYDRLPPAEEMDFKCDGLHDGFYASVPHKCQVYHHCLYGTRYDFLCANYTAFDQKTFICHFVSEVDCVNSKKFWHRNDALYEAASTTTVKPVVIYQPPAALNPSSGGGNRKPSTSNGRRRRPYRRRRPQYDYYDDDEEGDDYYDDEPRYQVTPEPSRPRNKRPRPRPRPVYDDEYEYEDERYDRRGDKRRGTYEDRRRYKEDRRKYDDEYEDEIEDGDDKFDRGSEDRVRMKDSDRKRRPDSVDNPRYEGNGKGNRRRKPAKTNDDYYEEDQERPNRKGASKDAIEDRPIRKSNRDNDDAQKSSSNSEKRARRPNNNKPKDPDEDVPAVEQRNRPRQTNKESASGKKSSRDRINEQKDSAIEETSSASRKINDNPPEGVPLVKPSSGSSIYDRPRAAPKIRPPVPKNEQDKYSYKTSTIKPGNGKVDDEEYYEDYEEQEPAPKRPSNKPKNEDSRRPYKQANDRPREATKMSASRQRNHSRRPNYDQEEVYQRERPLRNKNVQQDRNRKRPVVEYDEEYEDQDKSTKEVVSLKPLRSNGDRLRKTSPSSSISTSTSTTTTTTSAPEVTTKTPEKKDKAEPAVRIIKRPFLPSRGGSPFAARGLLPVGSKALLLQTPVQSQPINAEPLPKSPPRNQIVSNQTQSQIRQQPAYAQSNKIPSIERNPLDIKEDEYDVTLNDALNPTLPNLPVRNFPTSAFSAPANDYAFRRAPQRDYAEPQVSHSQKQQIRYQDVQQQGTQRYQMPLEYQPVERQQESAQLLQSNQQRFLLPESQSGPLNQRLGPQPSPEKYESAPSTFATKNNREQLVNSNSDYRAQFTHAVPVAYQFRTGPRITHVHAHPFYTTY